MAKSASSPTNMKKEVWMCWCILRKKNIQREKLTDFLAITHCRFITSDHGLWSSSSFLLVKSIFKVCCTLLENLANWWRTPQPKTWVSSPRVSSWNAFGAKTSISRGSAIWALDETPQRRGGEQREGEGFNWRCVYRVIRRTLPKWEVMDVS